MNKSLPMVAVLFASAALLTAGLKGCGDRPPPSAETSTETSRGLAAQLEQLELGQQALRESIQELTQKLAQLERANAAGGIGATDPVRAKPWLDDLGPAELVRLKQRLDELAAQERKAALEKELAHALAIVLDPNQTPQARVKQAHMLKRGDHFDDRAAKAMADLYRQIDKADLEQRLIVLDALSGVAPTGLRDQILADLSREVQGSNQSGLSRKFRHTAIGVLGPMLPDPSVQEWLGYLAQNDPDPDIAARAGKLIGLPPPAGGGGK